MKNFNRLLLALYASFLVCILFSCNSVKKSTSSKEVKVDSVVSSVIDSSSSSVKKVQLDSTSLKIWDKETVIEFNEDHSVKLQEGQRLGGLWNDSLKTFAFRAIEYLDGEIVVKNIQGVKKITIRSKGKDSTSLKKVDDSHAKSSVAKNGQTNLSKKDKSMESNKESKPNGIPWVLVFVLAALIGLGYVTYKYIKKQY